MTNEINLQQSECVSDESNCSNRIGPYDVLLGRGGQANNHYGNRLFRSIVLQYQLEYLQAKKLEKANVAKKVIATIQEQGGRFLEKREVDDAWSEVSMRKAQSKTSQALREGLDVKHEQLRIKQSQKAKKAAAAAAALEQQQQSFSKQRKPYTIKHSLAVGAVITNSNIENDETRISDKNSKSTTSRKVKDSHRNTRDSVDEQAAAIAIVSLSDSQPFLQVS